MAQATTPADWGIDTELNLDDSYEGDALDWEQERDEPRSWRQDNHLEECSRCGNHLTEYLGNKYQCWWCMFRAAGCPADG